MIEWLNHFAGVFLSTTRDLLPVVAIIFGFQLFVIRKPIANLRKVLIGLLFVLFGLTFFLQGLDQALFPLGRLLASQLTHADFISPDSSTVVNWVDYLWVYLFAFLIGFSTTIAEPSLLAVAIKANEVSSGAISATGLRIAVALGVAVGISLGSWRIVTGYPLQYFIIGGYLVVVIQTFFTPKMIVPIAYDSGGVTTSTVTVPLVAALGLGLAESVPGRSPLIDGFGLIAFASLFPIMSVMAYAQLSHIRAKRFDARAHKQKLDNTPEPETSEET